MKPITIGSLFSGIGGLDLGIERGLASAGVAAETIWQVEQSDFCRKILARHWPHAERYTDVRSVGPDELHPVDLLCGGFPCQDVSKSSSTHAGIEGRRSGLFWELFRIVREMGPRFIVLENVTNIRSRGADEICGALASIGYDLRFGSLSAAELGAPHIRDRWFLVAWRAVDRRPLWERCRCCEGFMCNRHGMHAHDCDCPAIEDLGWIDPYAEGSLADTDRQHASKRKGQRSNRPQEQPTTSGGGRDAPHWRRGQAQSEVGRGIAGIPARLDSPHRWPAPPGPQHAWEPPRTRPRQPHDIERLKALGNAVVPQCAAIIGHWIGSQLIESA